MTDSVDIAYTASCKGAACVEGGLLHVLTRLYIRAVLVGIEQVVVNQLYGLLGEVVFQLCIVGVIGVSFDSMAQGVHTGAGGGERRQVYGKLGIQHCASGYEVSIHNSRLVVCGGVGYDRRHGGFGA